jgi:hypothetical protein
VRGLTRPGRRTAAVAAVAALGVAGGTLLTVGTADGEQPAAAPASTAPVPEEVPQLILPTSA